MRDCAANALREALAYDAKRRSVPGATLYRMSPYSAPSCNGAKLGHLSARSPIMTELDPQRTFRGLPLTPEQDAEIRHYIKVCKQHGKPWDTPELDAMLRDMLEPPGEDDAGDDFDPGFAGARTAAERAQFSVEDETNPFEASEEWHAAMESETMKRLDH